MTEVITKIRVKQKDNSYGTDIPIGAQAENVYLGDGSTAEENFKSIQETLDNVAAALQDLKVALESAKVDIKEL